MNDNWRQAILDEAARVEESATYSSETQFEYAKRWRRADRVLAALAAAAAGVSGVGALTEVFGAVPAALVALLAAALAGVSAALNAPQTKEKAAGSANAYRALQQDVRIFRTIDLESIERAEAKETLHTFVERLQDLNAQAEIPSDRAWKRAKRQVESGSQTYEVDDG